MARRKYTFVQLLKRAVFDQEIEHVNVRPSTGTRFTKTTWILEKDSVVEGYFDETSVPTFILRDKVGGEEASLPADQVRELIE